MCGAAEREEEGFWYRGREEAGGRVGGGTFCANISTKTATGIRFLSLCMCVCCVFAEEGACFTEWERKRERAQEALKRRAAARFTHSSAKTDGSDPKKKFKRTMDGITFGRFSLVCTLLLVTMRGKLNWINHSLNYLSAAPVHFFRNFALFIVDTFLVDFFAFCCAKSSMWFYLATKSHHTSFTLVKVVSARCTCVQLWFFERDTFNLFVSTRPGKKQKPWKQVQKRKEKKRPALLEKKRCGVCVTVRPMCNSYLGTTETELCRNSRNNWQPRIAPL